MNLELQGKKVFITASTDGIGKAIAESFLEEGAMVIINGRNSSKLEKVIYDFSEKYDSHRIHGVIGDMTREEDIHTVKRFLSSQIGGLDILIGNLGTGKSLSANELDMTEWYHMYEYNLFSAVRLISIFKEMIDKQTDANIVLLSSLAGYDRIGAPIAYASAKNGIRTLVKYLADEYATYGIRVNGVAPGNVFFAGGRWEELLSQNREGISEYIEKEVPMKRFAAPEEIANAVLFLASNRASFITGEIVKVDGGQSRTV